MKISPVVPRRLGALLLLLSAMPLSGALVAQGKQPAPAPALLISALAGQAVPVLPVSYVIVDPSVKDSMLPGSHPALVSWMDSIVTEQVLARAPEVNWVVGNELRRKVRMAPGGLPTPDRMGQAALRFDNIKRVPDPLFGYLRTVVAIAGGRMVLVPAAIRFTTVDSMIRAETVWVLADGRSGNVIWRSSPVAMGHTAAEALRGTIDHIFPDAH